MRRMLTLASAMLLTTSGIGFGQDLKPAPKAVAAAESREAEIYKAAKSALANARGRAASKDLSIRKSAMARETAKAMDAVSKKFGISVAELDQIIRRGELADGTAAKKEASAAKSMAKANAAAKNEAILKAMSRPPMSLGQQMEAQRVADRYNRGADVNTGRMPGPSNTSSATSLCGATTKAGGSCRNPVAGGGRCYLHR